MNHRILSATQSRTNRNGRMRLAAAFSALILSWALPSLAQDDAASSKLSVLLENFEKRRAATMEPQEKLDARYAEGLEKLLQKARAAGDVSLVLAATIEADEFRKREGPNTERSRHTALANMQAIYARQSLQLAKKRRKDLPKLLAEQRDQLKQMVSDLTRAREFEQAVEARKEVKKLDAIILVETAPVRGRYVRVDLPREKGVLSLCEVQVMSGEENIAVKGKASQSSTYGNPANPIAEKAIDGNTDGDFNSGRSTTHTNHEKNPWWEVDLGEKRGLHRIVIWNRNDIQERLDGFKLSILDVNRKTVWEKTFRKAPKRELAIDLDSERKR